MVLLFPHCMKISYCCHLIMFQISDFKVYVLVDISTPNASCYIPKCSSTQEPPIPSWTLKGSCKEITYKQFSKCSSKLSFCVLVVIFLFHDRSFAIWISFSRNCQFDEIRCH
ncbi:hypothetical protein IHE45_12G022900 [Dioscorea alata]|uniref:Uncharacterized protein n=1 Tax=Dioscorea alata TaxID=55571 RepID=A0ACB7V0T7_DIOAL|nr:hypothetical protein IHE45_12G022900 [Dioscorea alata]